MRVRVVIAKPATGEKRTVVLLSGYGTLAAVFGKPDEDGPFGSFVFDSLTFLPCQRLVST